MSDLPPAATLILIALAHEVKHGYAMMNDIEQQTGGAYRVSAGTLYRWIAQLLEWGLIEAAPIALSQEDDERRKYYRLTAAGRSEAITQLQRIEKLALYARKQLNIDT